MRRYYQSFLKLATKPQLLETKSHGGLCEERSDAAWKKVVRDSDLPA